MHTPHQIYSNLFLGSICTVKGGVFHMFLANSSDFFSLNSTKKKKIVLWSESVKRFSVSRMRDFLQWLPNLQYPCWICLHTRGSILKLVSETKLIFLKCELQLFLTSFLVDVPTQLTGLLKCTILHSTVLYYSDAVAIAQCTPSHVLDTDFLLPIILRPPQHF